MTTNRKQISMYISKDLYWLLHETPEEAHRRTGVRPSLGELYEAAYMHLATSQGEDCTYDGVLSPEHTMAQVAALDDLVYERRNNPHAAESGFVYKAAPEGVIHQCDVCGCPDGDCEILVGVNVAFYVCGSCATTPHRLHYAP